MTERTYNQIGFNRLTKAQYDALATAGQINPYDLYFIVDEDLYAIADQVYTKTEITTLLSSYYTKTEVDGLVNGLATESYVDTKISDLINNSPDALNTLKELADALGNDANFSTTITNALSNKADKGTTLADYGITNAYTKTEVDTELGKKANSFTLKTINNESIFGEGNITIEGGSGGSDIDPTDYYVGDLKVSDSSNTSCIPTFGGINSSANGSTSIGSVTNRFGSIYSNKFYVNGNIYYLSNDTSYLNKLNLSGKLSLYDGSIGYGTYNLELPSKSGTLATTDDIVQMPTDYLTESSLKTLNGESLVGSGNILVTGGSNTITYMEALPNDGSSLETGTIIAVPGTCDSDTMVNLTPSDITLSSNQETTVNVTSGFNALYYIVIANGVSITVPIGLSSKGFVYAYTSPGSGALYTKTLRITSTGKSIYLYNTDTSSTSTINISVYALCSPE